ncbi:MULTISPECIES: CDP-alcohol phosphatidyltransferase family protein [Fischerella]|uniref:CDP-alcohol phosphatidyltransferase family protein n=1 Tax=Fischerella TaxID=1190 RepID=UPI0003177BBB|nr:CDP-alcohol phosphatidyltransferase family protein [Fischerella muscicola]
MNLTLIPSGLVLLRFLISPFLLWDAWDGKTSIWFITTFVVAFLSDILDGVIARRLGVSNAQLRQADSWADVCLYVCIAASAWLVYRDTVIAYRLPLLRIAPFYLVVLLASFTLSKK